MRKYINLSIILMISMQVSFGQNIKQTAATEHNQTLNQIADTIMKTIPEQLAQQQLDAYNNGNIDAFLLPYADKVEVYNFPNTLRHTGKTDMRPGYERFFKDNPDLHCEVVNRMVLGNTVIDHEQITGLKDGGSFKAIAIYKIKDDKIAEVYFIRE